MTLYMEHLIGIICNADEYMSVRAWAQAELDHEIARWGRVMSDPTAILM